MNKKISLLVLSSALVLSMSTNVLANDKNKEERSNISVIYQSIDTSQLQSSVSFGNAEEGCSEGMICTQKIRISDAADGETKLGSKLENWGGIIYTSAGTTTPDHYSYVVSAETLLAHQENGAMVVKSQGNRDVETGIIALSTASATSTARGTWEGFTQHSVSGIFAIEYAYTSYRQTW
ncbi:hypothetical protein [Paenibacillus sp. Leaf72]|uniref:hypothetical protein n=1 Tax=Paenibacillus sp. Leaf72 TaxID=1736234 RepID=UPI0006F63B0C|nr:hypothetical protein [Paenibacillus sp. Leaf72]KQN98867.1 hypothetical protein ASF12_18910 [Paenibacillus sp. Leaf72]